ncbi:bestrophin family ion channel, partial [Pseudomonas viridiflava]|uniref:bestrophin family ion channel n=1 Tax=Pseudomonas viridiflava TaxID=33069 RepID=UPI0023DD9358
MGKFRFLGKTIGYVGWSLFWLLIWDVIVTVDFMLYLERKITLPSMPLTLLGSALVVLTSFRNSSAYNRWWEACTLWGAMVNSSRSYGWQVLTLIDGEGSAR